MVKCRPGTRINFERVPGYPFEIIHTIFCNLCIVQTANSERSWCSHLRCRLILVTVLFIMCSYELTRQIKQQAAATR